MRHLHIIMFFFLCGVILGITVAQEYPQLPNMKILLHNSAKALQEAIRGGSNEFDAEKSD